MAKLGQNLEHLERALRPLISFTKDGQFPASALINPLLEVWEAAHEVAPAVCAPVELLLTAAVRRSTMYSDELIECIQEVRAYSIQEAVLADLVRG